MQRDYQSDQKLFAAKRSLFPFQVFFSSMCAQVVLEQYAAYTPLGTMESCVEGLLRGGRALRCGPCFDVPVAYAPFPDERFRDVRFAAEYIFSQMRVGDADAFLFCCAKGDIRLLEDHIEQRSMSTTVPPYLDGQARIVAGIGGGRFGRYLSVSSACASGAIGIEIAHEMLLNGSARQVLLFGFDVLSRFVVSGFHALNALSPGGARPFDATRDGLTPGECVAAALLTIKEPASGDIVVAGAGSANDANHRTGPSRSGEGLLLAAQACLENAAIAPHDIGAVKCHGTATVYNDAMEAKALTSLFGRSIPPCASFKGAIGHTSGAGSMLEILIAAECLRRRTLPPTVGYSVHGVDEPIPISAQPQPITTASILCLSAGFGGINAAVLIRQIP